LIVEDECLIRLCIRDLLEEAGFECAEAADAAQAIALLDGSGWVPDLLVSDYNLGPGPNGMAVADAALRRLPGLAVLFVTGNPECFEARAFGPREPLLAKPFLPDGLTDAVCALLSPDQHGVAAMSWIVDGPPARSPALVL
jgi:CheY-like chemotaxis protein